MTHPSDGVREGRREEGEEGGGSREGNGGGGGRGRNGGEKRQISWFPSPSPLSPTSPSSLTSVRRTGHTAIISYISYRKTSSFFRVSKSNHAKLSDLIWVHKCNEIRVIPYEIGTSFHPTPSDFAVNGVYCRVLIDRKLCQVSLSYLEPFPRKSVRRLTSTDIRGRAEITTSYTIDSSALTIELKGVKLAQVVLSGN